MRILQICHGYPPRENAGTETHTHQLVEALKHRGHTVRVVSTTRAPGRLQYSVMEDAEVTRIVNNLVSRPLCRGERDRAIEVRVQNVVEKFEPDIVHLQHVQYLSSGLRFSCPSIFTLHDQWTWCASGGLGVDRGTICPGPTPDRCAPCHARWKPVTSPMEHRLTRLAGAISPWIEPDVLHRLYRRLPPVLRTGVLRGTEPSERSEDAEYRNRQLRNFIRRTTVCTAPSRWLAERAEAMGMGPVRIIPHGVDGGLARQGGGPLLFLGSVAEHKGPQLVVQAWKTHIEGNGPDLIIHGPIIDAGAAAGHPVRPPLSRAGVWKALSEATALVMGSIWPENAPLVILEARAAGCPIVAPRIGGIPELVQEGRDGLLYEPGDAEDLGRALRALTMEPWTNIHPPPSHTDQVDAIYGLYEELTTA